MRKLTEEHKKKLSLAKIGHIPWNKGLLGFNKGHPGYNKGKKMPKEFCEKISKALKGKNTWSKGRKFPTPWLIGKKQSPELIRKRIRRGKNHWNWQGGRTKVKYPYKWFKLRELIRKRDNYKCKLCGCPQLESGRKLSIHHIDYNKKNLNYKNLITLCPSCHAQTHYRRKDWSEFLSVINVLNFDEHKHFTISMGEKNV